MIIPKIFHQSWKTESIPRHFNKFLKTWRGHHPEWEFRLWTDEMSREFMKNYYPEKLECYDSFPSSIQRVDMARCFILLKFGGVYIDLDFECIRNIEPLLFGESCVVGEEHYNHCIIHNKKQIISNAFIAASPNHEFIKELCYNFNNYENKSIDVNEQILESTGPFMLTRIYNVTQHRQKIKLLPFEILYPLTKDEIKVLSSSIYTPKALKAKYQNAYAIHYYWGTWWKRNGWLARIRSTILHMILPKYS